MECIFLNRRTTAHTPLLNKETQQTNRTAGVCQQVSSDQLKLSFSIWSLGQFLGQSQYLQNDFFFFKNHQFPFVVNFLSIIYLKTTIGTPYIPRVLYNSQVFLSFNPHSQLERKIHVRLCVTVYVCVSYLSSYSINCPTYFIKSKG